MDTMDAWVICQEMRRIKSYLDVRREPMWLIHTPAASTIGGFSCRLESFDEAAQTAVVVLANDDRKTVPLDEISWRGRDGYND